MTARNVQMEVDLKIENDLLTLTYTIKNNEKFAVYLTNIYLKRTEKETFLSKTNVPFALDGNTLLLKSRLMPLTTSISTYAPRSTYATKLAGGASYTDSFFSPLPVKIVDRSMVTVEKEDRLAKKIFFEMGIVPESPSLSAKEEIIDNTKVFLLSDKAWGLQFVISSEFKNTEIPVNLKNF